MERKGSDLDYKTPFIDSVHYKNWENAIDAISVVQEPITHPKILREPRHANTEVVNVDTAAMFSLPMLYFKNSGIFCGHPSTLVNRSTGKDIVFSVFGKDLKINPMLHRAEINTSASSSIATVFDICDSVAILKASQVGKTLVDGDCLSLTYTDNYTTISTSVVIENMALLAESIPVDNKGFMIVPVYCLKFYPVFSFVDKSPLLEWYGSVELD